MGLPLPWEYLSTHGLEQGGVEGIRVVARPVAAFQSCGTFFWSLGYSVCFRPICSSLGHRNFFHFRGWKLLDETPLVLPLAVLSPVLGWGSSCCWRGGHGVSHDVSLRGEAGGRFGSESCLLKRPRVPQAGRLALCLTGILIPASFSSQVLVRVVEKALYALQAEQC